MCNRTLWEMHIAVLGQGEPLHSTAKIYIIRATMSANA